MEDREMKPGGAKKIDPLDEARAAAKAIDARTADEGPYRAALMADAWRKGREARRKRVARDGCPLGDYPGRQFRRAWQEGWDSLGPPIKTMVPPVVSQSPTIATPGTFLPPGAALPERYQRPEPVACRNCRAILLPVSRAQAVILTHTSGPGGIACFRCRACEHVFRLPIDEPGRSDVS